MPPRDLQCHRGRHFETPLPRAICHPGGLNPRHASRKSQKCPPHSRLAGLLGDECIVLLSWLKIVVRTGACWSSRRTRKYYPSGATGFRTDRSFRTGHAPPQFYHFRLGVALPVCRRVLARYARLTVGISGGEASAASAAVRWMPGLGSALLQSICIAPSADASAKK